MWGFLPDFHNLAQDPVLECDLCNGSDNWECPVVEDSDIRNLQEMLNILDIEGKPLLTTTIKWVLMLIVGSCGFQVSQWIVN
jgi:hypothetical protein